MEFSRAPFSVIRKIRIIKYWFKILKFPDSIMFKIPSLRDFNVNFTNKWSVPVKEILFDIGFFYLWCNFKISQYFIDTECGKLHTVQ